MTYRRALGTMLGITLAGATVGVATRWADLAQRELAVVQSLVPICEATVVVVTLLSVWRHRRLALVAAVPALVSAGLLAAPFLPHTVPTGPGDVTVMTSNLEFGQADATQLVAAATARSVAVLVLVEVTPQGLSRLDDAGLRELLPYAAGSPEADASGTMVRSRYPLDLLSTGGGASGLQLEFRQPLVRVERPGAPFVIKAIHPLPPTGWPTSWRASLRLLADFRRAWPTDEPLVLAGDFNASVDHPAYREVAEGMADVTRDAGAGWTRTWPQDVALPPFVQLDHVLVRGLSTVAAGTVHLDGTDHAAVWGTVR